MSIEMYPRLLKPNGETYQYFDEIGIAFDKIPYKSKEGDSFTIVSAAVAGLLPGSLFYQLSRDVFFRGKNIDGSVLDRQQHHYFRIVELANKLTVCPYTPNLIFVPENYSNDLPASVKNYVDFIFDIVKLNEDFGQSKNILFEGSNASNSKFAQTLESFCYEMDREDIREDIIVLFESIQQNINNDPRFHQLKHTQKIYFRI